MSNTTEEEITDESYDACTRKHSLLWDQIIKTDKEYDRLSQILANDTDRKDLNQARAIIRLSLNKSVMDNEFVKLAQPIIKHNKLKISEIRGRIPLEEKSDVAQKINTIFERKIIQHSDLQGARKLFLKELTAKLEVTNNKIREAEQNISSLEREKEEISLLEKDITKKKKEIQIKIRDIGKKISKIAYGKKTQRSENAFKEAQNEYSTQEKLVAELQDKKGQAEMGNTTQQTKEIDDQQIVVAELNRSIADIDAHDKQIQLSIDKTSQKINENNYRIEQAEDIISSIESVESSKTIEELREEQQKSEKKQEQASNNKEHYARLAQGIEANLLPLRQQIEKLEDRMEELSESFGRLMKEQDRFQRGKTDLLRYSFAEFLRSPRAEEVLGPQGLASHQEMLKEST